MCEWPNDVRSNRDNSYRSAGILGNSWSHEKHLWELSVHPTVTIRTRGRSCWRILVIYSEVPLLVTLPHVHTSEVLEPLTINLWKKFVPQNNFDKIFIIDPCFHHTIPHKCPRWIQFQFLTCFVQTFANSLLCILPLWNHNV